MGVNVKRVFFAEDEQGFTTVGAAVAILLACALVFGGLRAAWVGTHSGDVQYVADAGALAADNAIAEFVTLGQVVDAALLSLSLLGLTVFIASAVAAFIPGGQSVAGKLAQVGGRILKLRDSAARSAIKGLNAAQKALPALCAVRAANCVEANSAASGMGYHGFALVFPAQGVKVELPDDSAIDEAVDKIEDEEDEVEKYTKEAEELQQKQDAAKEEAWTADCGKQGMNMRERAEKLAGLSGADNPNYSSWENWSFSVALSRVKRYYRARYEQEPGADAAGSPELVGESVARKQFYAYAISTVRRGKVAKSPYGAELPYLEGLVRNTSQVRETYLYTDSCYPVSLKDGVRTLHAYAGCPGFADGAADGTAAVSAIDAKTVHKCPLCKYSATTLGRVPSPSTSIDNGFEYYYRIIVEKAAEYRAAVERAEEVKDKLEESRAEMVKAARDGLKGLAATRYDPQPPGRYGCVCVVYASAQQVPANPFAASGGQLPVRVALSGAELAADESSRQGNVIAEVGANLISGDNLGSGVAKTVFGGWGTALQAYEDGNNAVVDLLNNTLGAIPLVGNDLSQWAVSGFTGAVEKAGLKPPKLVTYKPVLVNTAHVVARDDSAVAKTLLKLKKGAQAYGDVSMGDFQALAQTFDVPDTVADLLGDAGLAVMKFALEKVGLGTGETTLTLGAPKDLPQQYRNVMEQARKVGG